MKENLEHNTQFQLCKQGNTFQYITQMPRLLSDKSTSFAEVLLRSKDWIHYALWSAVS